MRWATRAGAHIDRAAMEDVSEGAVPFEIRDLELGHHGDDCTFETALRITEPTFDAVHAHIQRSTLGRTRER
ncbi:MAG: hypothetical protein ACRDO7_14760 [Nocardioidaceae bacterium]